MAVAGDAAPAGRWPAWTVPAALVAGTLAGQLVAIVAIAPLAAFGSGDGDISAVSLLFASLAFGAALVATVAILVRPSQPLSRRTLGLVIPAAGPALAWTALGAALVGAFIFLWSQVADLADAFAVPSELDGRNSLAERLELGRPAQRADAGIGALASALARVVVPAFSPRSSCAGSRSERWRAGAASSLPWRSPPCSRSARSASRWTPQQTRSARCCRSRSYSERCSGCCTC